PWFWCRGTRRTAPAVAGWSGQSVESGRFGRRRRKREQWPAAGASADFEWVTTSLAEARSATRGTGGKGHNNPAMAQISGAMPGGMLSDLKLALTCWFYRRGKSG